MAPEIWDRGWKCSHKCSQSFSSFRFSKYPKLNIFYKTFYFGMSKLVLLRFSEWGWSLIEMFTQHTWRNILPTIFKKKICYIDLLRPLLNPGLKWLPDPFIPSLAAVKNIITQCIQGVLLLSTIQVFQLSRPVRVESDTPWVHWDFVTWPQSTHVWEREG